MKKLLVPVDGSANAQRALQYAINLAIEHQHIEIYIVTAHEAASENPRAVAYQPLEMIKQSLREQGEAILLPAVEMAKDAEIKYASEVLTGSVPQVIVNHAEASGCDGIVMGTRGMGAIANLLLGSVATKVIHLTKLPVTLVK